MVVGMSRGSREAVARHFPLPRGCRGGVLAGLQFTLGSVGLEPVEDAERRPIPPALVGRWTLPIVNLFALVGFKL